MPQTVTPPQKARLPGLDAAATPLIGLGLGLTGIVLGLRPRLAAYPLALTVLAALLYRDPRRRTPREAAALFAPADGTVTAVDELYEHRFLHTDAVRLAIMTAPFDVPVQRSPAAGVISFVESVAGEDRALWDRGDSTHGEQLYIGITTVWGPLLLAIHAGSLTSHLVCHVHEGEQVGAGARLATARFGARAELALPADVVEALPLIGDRLRAGVTAIGQVRPRD